MSPNSVTNVQKKDKKRAKNNLHINGAVLALMEGKVASPLSIVKTMLTDPAFELLDYSAEIRSKQSAVEKFSKTFGEEEIEFVAKRVRTEKNE